MMQACSTNPEGSKPMLDLKEVSTCVNDRSYFLYWPIENTKRVLSTVHGTMQDRFNFRVPCFLKSTFSSSFDMFDGP